MINQETRPIEISQIRISLLPLLPSLLSHPSAKKRKKRERKRKKETNWRRCAVNVLNDGILITRHVTGAIKQLAAVSISPMHPEASAYAHVATNSPVGTPRLSKRSIGVDIGPLIFLVNPRTTIDRSYSSIVKKRRR